jgi:diguanylate cyclase (GGDEF)-like protein
MDRIEITRVARTVAPYVALWLAVAAGLMAFAAYELDRHRKATLASGRAEADNLAQVMSEHMVQVLESEDRRLSLLKLVHEGKFGADAFAKVAAAMQDVRGTESERRVMVFGADGRLVDSVGPARKPTTSFSVSDRGYFLAATTRQDQRLLIGEPVVGRSSNHVIIPVAKRLETADGTFDGVVVAALDPHRLVRLFHALRVGTRSSVGIAHRDGPVIARAQSSAAQGMRAPLQTIGEVVQSGHVIALAAVRDTELLAFASLSEDELLAEHARYAFSMLAFLLTTLAAITLPIVLVGGRAWREVHRRRLLEIRYQSAYQQARTDPLTGLANRTAFDEARREAHARQRRSGEPFALAFLDIDHFKRLNDTLGHAVGDEALKTVAETLSGCVRQTDVVGRLGGDEFAVLMPGVTGDTMHRRFDPIKVDLDNVAARFSWPISFSIGVVACETAMPRSRDAINLADRLMYDAKSAGRDAVRYGIWRDGRLNPDRTEPAAEVA